MSDIMLDSAAQVTLLLARVAELEAESRGLREGNRTLHAWVDELCRDGSAREQIIDEEGPTPRQGIVPPALGWLYEPAGWPVPSPPDRGLTLGQTLAAVAGAWLALTAAFALLWRL